MKIIKNIGCLITFALLLFTSCENTTQDQKKLTLMPDKTEITADGKDAIAFTVKFDNHDVTADAEIENITTGEKLVGNTFTSTKGGQYTFRATYQEFISNDIIIPVKSVDKLMLVADRTNMIADGVSKVTFTAFVGELDVTADVEINNLTNGATLPKGNSVFSTSTEGIYEFYVEYQGVKSNTIQILASNSFKDRLVLHPDTPRIKADGQDKATFRVLFEGADVTADAKIKNVSTGQYIDGNTFTYSGSEKTVNFVAEYDGKVSEQVNIGFGEFYKNVMLLRYTGTWCAPCTSFSYSLKAALEEYPDRLLQVSAHVSDEMTTPAVNIVSKEFTSTSIPTYYFDYYQESKVAGNLSKDDIIKRIKTYEAKGADCGIAATSVLMGDKGVVEIRFTPIKSGRYYVGAYLLEDGLDKYPQTGADPGYVHNDTLRELLSSSVYGDMIDNVAENQEASIMFEFNVNNYVPENCRIVCFVTETVNFNRINTNIISCPVNSTVDYRFEK